MPLQVDSYKQYRYMDLVGRLRSLVQQIRGTAKAMDDFALMFSKNASIMTDIQDLAPNDYLLNTPDSPTRQEFEDAIQAVLSYAVYAGALSPDEYTAITGAPPLTPDEINVKIDSYPT